MDGIDLEEANRIRQALGLKPIAVPGETSSLVFQEGANNDGGNEQADTLDGRHAAAHDNWSRLEAQRAEEEDRKKRKADIKKKRDAAQRFVQLDGKGLGDLSDDDELEDTKSWLLKSRKRRKRIEADRADRQAAEQRQEEAEKRDYTSADLGGLRVGHQIDQFGDEGERILVLKDSTVGGDNSDDDELENLDLRDQERLEVNLKNKKRKAAYNPLDEDGTAILSHYDDKISGPKKSAFSIADLGRPKETDDPAEQQPKYLLYEDVVDKKRSKRRARTKAVADLVRANQDQAIEDSDVGLVIDETTEFVSALRAAGTEGAQRRQRTKEEEEAKSAAATAAGSDPTLPADGQPGEMDEDDDEVPVPVKVEAEQPTIDSTEVFAEQTISTGLGSTLNMLTSRGLLQKTDGEKRNDMLRQKQRFLAMKQAQETVAEVRARKQREEDRKSGKFDRMTAREKEVYSQTVNSNRDLAEARRLAEEFDRHYRPDVQLKYVDEHGQVLANPKEAFKHLSHIFHGKGSGNKKTEKKLKKIEDEKKKEAQSIMDSSASAGAIDNAASNRAKNSRQAGVRFA